TPKGPRVFPKKNFQSNGRNARNEAQSRKKAVERRFSRMHAYVTFDSPYWRVRVGDFHTRAEAEHALTELRRSFPGFGASFRIVRDRINP
ncbi:MAG: SPOR domain-containing protein, partial [Muribaculaceae bacterium]|nr:SPOR domain-containing protein [Muribaculaceae bacterium]